MSNNFYQNYYVIFNPTGIDVLVNKFHKLESNYIPKDLVIVPSDMALENRYLRKEAYDAFKKMHDDALGEGFNLIITSAYRSYEYQEGLYAHYVEEMGQEKADMASARPGFSEHQTGLAIDIANENFDYMNFETTDEFDWMIKHAHEYGFILRYPKDKPYITGFKYEPWHYRYVGTTLATYLHDYNLTLDEYYHN